MRALGGRVPVRRGIAAVAVSACALAGPALGAGGDIGFQGPATGPVPSELTMSKPQSKLWFTSRGWWGEMLNATSRHYDLFRLDRSAEKWVDTGVEADPVATTRADVLWDAGAGKLYVASHKLSPAAETTHQPDIPNPPVSTRPPELWRYSYDAAANKFVPDAGFPVKIGDFDVEALVIAKDSTGRLWATWTVGDKVWVNHTSGADTDWGSPYVIPGPGTSLTPDDISSAIAFGGNKIGVMWSNQNDGHFYFAVHDDGAGDGSWNVSAVPYSEFSDDHINLKADAGGQVYAVVKSGATAPDAPAVSVLVRTASGAWSEHTVWRVKDHPTRATMLLDDQQHVVHVFATGPLPDDPANIDGMLWTKSASTNALSFPDGYGTPLMRDVTAGGEVHDATSTKQNIDSASGMVVLGSDEIAQRYWFTDTGAGTAPGGSSGGDGSGPAGPGGPVTPSGGGGSAPPSPPPPPTPSVPVPRPAVLRNLVLPAAQHGSVVRGRVTLGYDRSVLRAAARGPHARAAAGAVVRRALHAGTVRFAVRLDRRARAALARTGRVVLLVRVAVTAPGHGTATATRRVVLRAR